MAARGVMTSMHFSPHGSVPHGPVPHGSVPRSMMPRKPVRAMLRQSWAMFLEMRRAHRTRRLLAEMDDRLLADIGIGRGEALMEASRAPWDIGRR